jgi:YD repeat-containing protein
MKKSFTVNYWPCSVAISIALAITSISCTEDVGKTEQICRLEKFGDFAQHNYDSIAYNAQGEIASVTWKQPGGNQRFDYTYAGNKISIHKTDLLVNHQLVCVIDLDTQGRPVARTEGSVTYEKYIYSGDRLDHIMWPTKDSIAFTYEGASKNPKKAEFHQYKASTKTWSKLNSTIFTFDDKANPLKGMILPVENWNLEAYFFENNRTSYASDNGNFVLTYDYNNEGYPTSRTLTFAGFNETKGFAYDCD